MQSRYVALVSCTIGLVVGSLGGAALSDHSGDRLTEPPAIPTPAVSASPVLFQNVDGTQEWGFLLAEGGVELMPGMPAGQPALTPSDLEIVTLEVVNAVGETHRLKPDDRLGRLLLDRYGQRQG